MNLHRLDLLSLSRFSFVVRTASIGRAVELAHLALARLALAHPAVGAAIQRISNLDGNLGAEHFERNSRGVTLTFAGHTLE